MSGWVLDEKGTPENGDWELSIVRHDNSHGLESYGWDGEDKLIVWSNGGPCRYTCDTVVAKHIREAAKAALDELNGGTALGGTLRGY